MKTTSAKTIIIVLCVMVVAGLGWIFFRKNLKNAPITEIPPASTSTAQFAEKPNLIRVTSPAIDELVTSPMHVRGEARGYWFFEASFPVKLIAEDGTIISWFPAQATKEWMTEDYVPFELNFEFTPKGKRGTLVLEKDNPSGLSEHADELRIPVRFE